MEKERKTLPFLPFLLRPPLLFTSGSTARDLATTLASSGVANVTWASLFFSFLFGFWWRKREVGGSRLRGERKRDSDGGDDGGDDGQCIIQTISFLPLCSFSLDSRVTGSRRSRSPIGQHRQGMKFERRRRQQTHYLNGLAASSAIALVVGAPSCCCCCCCRSSSPTWTTRSSSRTAAIVLRASSARERRQETEGEKNRLLLETEREL